MKRLIYALAFALTAEAAACLGVLQTVVNGAAPPADKLVAAYAFIAAEGDGKKSLTVEERSDLIRDPFTAPHREPGRAQLVQLIQALKIAYGTLPIEERAPALDRVRAVLIESEQRHALKQGLALVNERPRAQPWGRLEIESEARINLLNGGKTVRYRKNGIARADRPTEEWTAPTRTGGGPTLFDPTGEWVLLRDIDSAGKPFFWAPADPSKPPSTPPPFQWPPEPASRSKDELGTQISADGSRFFVRLSDKGGKVGSLLVYETADMNREPREIKSVKRIYGVSHGGSTIWGWTHIPAIEARLLQWDLNGTMKVIPTDQSEVLRLGSSTGGQMYVIKSTQTPHAAQHLLEIDSSQARVVATKPLDFMADWQFSPDAQFLAGVGDSRFTSAFNRTAALYSVPFAHVVAKIKFADPVTQVSFSPDGKSIAFGGPTADQKTWVRIYNVDELAAAGTANVE